MIIDILKSLNCSERNAKMTEAYNYWFEHRGEDGENHTSVAIKFGVKLKSLTERVEVTQEAWNEGGWQEEA